MAIHSVQKIPKARFIGMVWMFLSLLGAVCVGIIGVVYFAQKPLENPEAVFIAMSQGSFPDFLAGLFLASVLSAIMSSVSSQLIVLSSVIAEDLYKPLRKGLAGPLELLWMGRLCVILTSCVSFFLAFQHSASVLSIVAYAWSGLGATIGPVVLLSLFWSSMTRSGAISAMLVGAITVIAWEKLGFLGGIFSVYSIVPGFLATTLTAIFVSIWASDRPSWEMRAIFESVRREVRC